MQIPFRVRFRAAAGSACVGLLALLAAQQGHAAGYTIEAIGWANAFSTHGSGISERGTVTGQWCCDSRTPAGTYPFVYRDGHFKKGSGFEDMGSLGLAVSDRGVVVGTAQAAFQPSEGFYDTGEGPRLIGHGARDAVGVNASGQVVGTTDNGPYLYALRSGQFQLLPTLGFYAIGAAVNDAGRVAGSYYVAASGESRAYLYRDGATVDLGTLGGASAWAEGLNRRDEVTGCAATADGRMHAVVWRDGAIDDLTPDLPSAVAGCGRAINGRGDVVGQLTPPGRNPVPFLHAGGRLATLASLLDAADAARWELIHAAGINDRGEISGTGKLDGDKERAFIMRPRP